MTLSDRENWLAGKLRMDLATDPRWRPLWMHLTEIERVDSAYDDAGLKDLLQAARSWLRSVRTIATTSQASTETIQSAGTRDPVDAPRLEAARARALSDWFRVTGNARPDVQKFRERYLGGTLDNGDARRFLRSWPNRICPSAMFVSAFERGSLAKPFLNDTVRPVEECRDGKRILRVDPPGWNMFGTLIDDVFDPGKLVYLGYVESDGKFLRRAETSYRAGSVVDELSVLGRKLETAYDWREYEGAWFLLTGHAPYVPAATVLREWSDGGWHIAGKVTLEVQAWVSVETVSRAYRDAQRTYFDKHRNIPISEKRTELFRFIIQRIRLIDEGTSLRWESIVTWSDLMHEWNMEHPEWTYRHWRTLATDFRRATRAIVRPPLGFPVPRKNRS